MKHLLWSKARASRGAQMVSHYKKGLDGEQVPIMRARRDDNVHASMRRFLHKPTPLLDNHGREVPPYMQLDTVKRPKYVQLLTGQVVEYTGP